MEIKKSKTASEVWEIIKSLAIIVICVVGIRTFIAQPFIVSGESMFPTFHNKDYLVVDELSYRFKEPARGEVIVLRYPVEPNRFFIKRIIGIPGDTISFESGKVFLQKPGEQRVQLQEPYYRGATNPMNINGPTILKKDEYFVMGDNRNFSSDSRVWGILPKKDIIGRAFLRLLPLRDIDYLPGSIASFNK
jgi:signal peptidase I